MRGPDPDILSLFAGISSAILRMVRNIEVLGCENCKELANCPSSRIGLGVIHMATLPLIGSIDIVSGFCHRHPES